MAQQVLLGRLLPKLLTVVVGSGLKVNGFEVGVWPVGVGLFALQDDTLYLGVEAPLDLA